MVQGCSLSFFSPFLFSILISFETGRCRPAAGRCFFFLAVVVQAQQLGLCLCGSGRSELLRRELLSPNLCPISAPRKRASKPALFQPPEACLPPGVKPASDLTLTPPVSFSTSLPEPSSQFSFSLYTVEILVTHQRRRTRTSRPSLAACAPAINARQRFLNLTYKLMIAPLVPFPLVVFLRPSRREGSRPN
jgi:hypothetical protein